MPLLHIFGGPSWLDWSFHPDVILLCAALLRGYAYTVTKLRERWSDAARVKRSQVVYFVSGVLVIFAVSGSPMHDLADRYLVSAHMVQHVMLTLAAAPLMLAGIPSWFWQRLLKIRGVMPVAKVLTNGVVALLVFNTVLVLTHLPESVELQVTNGAFHMFAHVVLVAAGFVLWWPVLSSVPELPRLSYPLQMGYLFMQSLLPTVMASFITFSEFIFYPVYAETPQLWGISPEADQQIAGGLMKVLGSLILWSFIAVAFFKWYAKEEAEAQGPRWQEVEEELHSLGLTTKQ